MRLLVCKFTVLVIRNDLLGSRYEFLDFRIRICYVFFKAYLDILIKKQHLIINQKEEFTNFFPFSISHYSPESSGLKFRNIILVYLLLLAVSGTIISDPGPGKSSGFDRIRIYNTANICETTFLSYAYHFV